MVYTHTPGEVPKLDLDPAQLFEEIGRDRALLEELIETALQDLPDYLHKVRAAAARKDMVGVRQFSHAMKTTLAHWQAKEAHQLALSIELLCREDRGLEALALLPQLEVAIPKVVQALHTLEIRP